MDSNSDVKSNAMKFNRQFALSSDDDIVISGVSGRFPNSHNVDELAYKLYNKIDCCDDAETRFRHRAGIPKRQGTVYDLDKFDASFFGFNQKLANATDPQTRCIVEHAWEAVLDAGVNPIDIKGSNTGVYTSVCTMESTEGIINVGIYDGYTIVGQNRGMLANRISYVLDLKGPSFVVDSACSSTMMALNCAYSAMRNGECDAAIVGGSNLTLAPITSLHFARLGVLAMDGYCRPFDKNASGYTRSEAISTVFLQKRRDAKRCYATLVHSKINCDGYKEQGITYPAGHIQKILLNQFYEEINLSPLNVCYVEAHGTGTGVGDPEECEAIYQAFCKGRKEPLLVGSVKSSIGHTEPVSALCSLVKCVLALETGKISPNINFEEAHPAIMPLREGHLKVVAETTDLPGELVAASSFGFGGANGHILLKRNNRIKVNHGLPNDSLPRLVVWNGRTEESCNVVFDEVVKRPLDAEFIGLLHSCQTHSIQANMYRGFGLFTQQGDGNAICVGREVERSKGARVPLVFVYSGMGSQWTQMGSSLMQLPTFRKTIEECHKVLEKKGLNLIEILTSNDKKTFDNILHSFVGIAAIQIALTNILREMDIEPDYIIGHSVGELGCAYADGCFTAEEMILSAYSRGMASLETKVIFGSMAAIGLSYEQICPMLPEGIAVACHNGPDSCTISGPAELVAKFVKELTDKGIFAREVPCSNIPYHSKYIADMGPKLLARLKEVIKTPKQRSTKWLSTSVPESNWNTPAANYCSAEYQTNNLLSSVLFEETMRLLPENAVTIEIAPHGLLQAILRKGMTSSYHISLTQRNNVNNINILFAGLGKLYNQGWDIPIAKLYPPIQFPVSAGTPMIGHLIKWDHSDQFFVADLDSDTKERGAEQRFVITLSSKDYEYISGHKIDGRVLFPATGYLFIAWNAFARSMRAGDVFKDVAVEISDIKFVRATTLTKGTQVTLTIVMHYGTGRFEISESDATVVTGHIKELEKFHEINVSNTPKPDSVVLKTSDFYKELKLRGYHYDGEFKSVLEANSDASHAKISWHDNFVSFMDCMLQIGIIGIDSRSLMVPTALEKIQIDPAIFLQSLEKAEDIEFMNVQSIKELQVIQTKGIRMQGLKASTIMRRKPPGEPVLESYKFVPFLLPQNLNIQNAMRVIVQLGLETVPTLKVKGVEIGDHSNQLIIPHIQSALGDLPMIAAELTLLTHETELDIPGVTIDNEATINDCKDCLFVIGADFVYNSSKLEDISKSCKQNGFIISIENSDFGSSQITLPDNFDIISVISVDNMCLVMIQCKKKKDEQESTYLTISVNDTSFSWLEEAKQALKKGKLYIIAQGEPLSGIIGLVNCLRREPKCDATCIFIDDNNAPKFDPENPFYKKQLEKGLGINVYRHGAWGSYRHLALNEVSEPRPQTGHYYANTTMKGDLSSFTWFKGGLNTNAKNIVKIRYSALNFRDVMIATGKLDLSLMYSRLEQDCIIGFEFSGIDQNGKRVMGINKYGSLGTHAVLEDYFTWELPPHWTLEEAATVPCVYTTVYGAFFVETHIEKGKSILIHAGTGGVGLAAIRTALHYGLEVFTTVSVEIGDHSNQLIIPHIQSALGDLPMIAAELTLLTHETELDIPGVTIDNEATINDCKDCLFVIGADFVYNSSKLEDISKSCKQNGFIISIENADFGSSQITLPDNFDIISVISVDNMCLVMIQCKKKKDEQESTYLTISVNDTSFSWLEEAKQALKKGKLYIIAQGEPLSGIIGLVNCLRREPKCDATCIFIDDNNAPKFDPENPFYKKQLEKGLGINVYRHGAWGSYRHLALNEVSEPRPQTGHYYANTTMKGDLSSFTWFKGGLNTNAKNIVKIRYSALNFRDVMIATGKLDLSLMYSRLEQDCIIGFEFSGIDQNGKRVMGINKYGSLGTHAVLEDYFTWELPPHWTLEEAATVPCVYTTVYGAFFVETHIEKGKSILIHAGTGGVGLAAIRTALHYGLEVFTTVSTEEKKQYLLDLFPKLKPSHIGNSRDTSFYEMVMLQTKGIGVDYVLNSLADDKLITSLRCLAEDGHFLEIGKYDILNDSKIGLGHFAKNITFHVIMLDKVLKTGVTPEFIKLNDRITKDIHSGVIAPLRANTFEAKEIEKAFRFLASGKHMGKVLIKIREDDFSEESLPIPINPVVYCKPNLSYIIPGGLGGFGLELADWLVLRGCRNLVLSSSKGISKPYQEYRIQLWRSYGVNVTVSTSDIRTPKGCLELIKTGLELGPVGGIFNLAVILRDNIFENQDAEKFVESLSVKAYATKYLDEISRKLCPQLEHFVVFSSVSCGRGNAGQTNYGMANSIMERIVESRVSAGFPGKAIQWGAVGEVGLVAQMAENKIDVEIGGTLQQRISSCLQVLDVLMTCPDPVTASMVVAEKKIRAGTGILGTVMNIIGIKDIKSIPMDQKLSEVGMDSLMAVEIKQTLERDYELVLSPQDLRVLTLKSLIDMTNKKSVNEDKATPGVNNRGLAVLFRDLSDEVYSTELIVPLKTKGDSTNTTVILPGVEGIAGKVWNDLGAKLNFSATVIQYKNTPINMNIHEMVESMFNQIIQGIIGESKTFKIIGYSFGSLLAIILTKKLEELGFTGKLILIEGSPVYLKNSMMNGLNAISQENHEAEIEFYLASIVMSYVAPNKPQEKLMTCKTFNEKIDFILSQMEGVSSYTEHAREMMNVLLKNTLLAYKLEINKIEKLKTDITLIRASEPMFLDIPEDYELSKQTSGEIHMKCVDGNHMTILDSDELVEILNQEFEQ
uniref:CSON007834 protein n=2 Tax=Culicoides sonorensis TaxID=179676 RepID=A0A336MX78_CULSO